MIRIALIILFLAGLFYSTSHSVIVEFEMPNLSGEYPYLNNHAELTFSRLDSITYYGSQAYVLSVSLRITGINTHGLIECWFSTIPDTLPLEPRANSTILKSSDPGNWWAEYAIYDDGTFLLTLENISTNGFSTLTDSDVIEVELAISPFGWLDVCSLISWPETTVHSAFLVFDLEYSIPTEPDTWGKIKALYGEAN